MDPAIARQIAADLAATLLLLMLFGIELVAIAVLWSAWRGLKLARRRLPELLIAADGGLRRADERVRTATDAALRPQIAVASRWAGLRAGARALVGRR